MQRLIQLLSLVAALLPFAPVIAQVDSEQREIDWQTNAFDYRGQYRKAFNVYCPPAGKAATVWGTGVYTDDSSICTAAVHALATFDFARGGTVYFAMEPGQEGYDGDRRRGVSTQVWSTFWDGGYRIIAGAPGKKQSELNDLTPLEIPWTTSAKYLRGKTGSRRVLLCPSKGEVQPVWGNDVYTDDSSICAAAVHAGVITVAHGGGITMQTEVGRDNYAAQKRNGVASLPWERWNGSFSVPRGQKVLELPVAAPIVEEVEPVRGPAVAPVMRATSLGPSGELLLQWNTTASDWRGQRGQVKTAYCPASGITATVWGSTLHTDDSSICTAAVHSLATFTAQSGGTVQFEMLDGRNSYVARQKNGVAALEWGAWESSFRIISGVPGKRPNEIGNNTELEISWSTTGARVRSKSGLQRVRCAAIGDEQAVWGNDSYSDNSSVCTAAVHAGLITTQGGGVVTLVPAAVRQNFVAAMRNGVASLALNAPGASFTLRK